MITFLYFDLKSLAMKLLELVVKPIVINPYKTGKQLTEIDLLKKITFSVLRRSVLDLL